MVRHLLQEAAAQLFAGTVYPDMVTKHLEHPAAGAGASLGRRKSRAAAASSAPAPGHAQTYNTMVAGDLAEVLRQQFGEDGNKLKQISSK